MAQEAASTLLNISDRAESIIAPDLDKEALLYDKLNKYDLIVPVPFLKVQGLFTD